VIWRNCDKISSAMTGRAVSLIQTNVGLFKAASAAYLPAEVAVPVLVARRSLGSRSTLSQAVRRAAVASVAVNLVLCRSA